MTGASLKGLINITVKKVKQQHVKSKAIVATENTVRWHLPDHIQQIGLFWLDQNLKQLPGQLGTVNLETSAETRSLSSNWNCQQKLKPELQNGKVRRSLNIWLLEHHFTWTPSEEHAPLRPPQNVKKLI
ncbi:hypothetical protein AVEN_5539-1 [Araneus ventricosus]|uniref:Uncharacterized protein n=1 Tax=Araneus ventricosus TaxID=182803 RepID=A0A4Y2DXA6_ARAVE|nr:hypothetical protein AVEN_5539-1 [Araneus ventricosus]